MGAIRGAMGKKRRDNTGLGVEEKYEEVRQLVSMGRERGFLALDEINELLPEDVSSSTEEILLLARYQGRLVMVVITGEVHLTDPLLSA